MRPDEKRYHRAGSMELTLLPTFRFCWNFFARSREYRESPRNSKVQLASRPDKPMLFPQKKHALD